MLTLMKRKVISTVISIFVKFALNFLSNFAHTGKKEMPVGLPVSVKPLLFLGHYKLHVHVARMIYVCKKRDQLFDCFFLIVKLC